MTDKKKKTTTQTRSASKSKPVVRPKAAGPMAKVSTRTSTKTKTKTKTRIKSKADPASQDKAGKQTRDDVVSPDEIIFSESETLPEDESVGIKKKSDARESSSKPAIYDPVSAYYQTLRHYPVLTRDEEKEVAIRYLETEDIDSAYTLVTSNLKLVIKIALEYRRLWREIVDLIQEGNVGLMQAVKKYDPYRGVRFSSYAAWWVRAYIIRYIMNNTRMVKIGTTQAQRTLYFQLGKERERLRRMGIEPDSKAIAKSLKVKE